MGSLIELALRSIKPREDMRPIEVGMGPDMELL